MVKRNCHCETIPTKLGGDLLAEHLPAKAWQAGVLWQARTTEESDGFKNVILERSEESQGGVGLFSNDNSASSNRDDSSIK